MTILMNLISLLIDGIYSMWIYHVTRYPRTTYSYAHYEGKDLKLDLYLPDATKAPYPTIIYVHGGGWITGSRKNVEPGIVRQVKNGYAVAAVSYSLLPQAHFPQQIHEVKAAIRWLRVSATELNINPDKFIIWGVSAGGHIANLIGATSGTDRLKGKIGYLQESSDVQGVISWYAMNDLSYHGNNRIVEPFIRWNFKSYLNCKTFDLQAAASQSNPTTYLHNDTPPFYIAHGLKDQIIDIHQSDLLYQALQQNNSLVRMETFPDFYHADWRMNYSVHLKKAEIFLNQIVMTQ